MHPNCILFVYVKYGIICLIDIHAVRMRSDLHEAIIASVYLACLITFLYIVRTLASFPMAIRYGPWCQIHSDRNVRIRILNRDCWVICDFLLVMSFIEFHLIYFKLKWAFSRRLCTSATSNVSAQTLKVFPIMEFLFVCNGWNYLKWAVPAAKPQSSP